ncbi:MAG TPA: DUF1648 domain-containing protein, partial [Euzebya sp.]|nr:DUF1648 domain-containing protein [Euzebya sp.]
MSITSHARSNLIVGAALPVAVAAGALALVWQDLPSSVAIHWGPSGAPNGFMNRSGALVALTLGMPMLTWAVLLAVTASVPRSAPGSRALQALPAGTSWFLLTLLILS